MINDDDLGEKIDPLSISSTPIKGALPPPKKGPWDTAESVDSEFNPGQWPQRPSTPPPVGREVAYNPQGAGPSGQAPTSAQAPATPQTKPLPPAPVSKRFKATAKESRVLGKFREAFGLKRVDSADAVITRKHPRDPEQEISMKFTFRGLGYDDYLWALLTAANSGMPSQFAFRVACCAMMTAAIDDTPIWEVFGLEPLHPDDVTDPLYPHKGIRFNSAEMFMEELRTSMHDIVDDLFNQISEKVDDRYMLKQETPEEAADGAAEPERPLP